MKQIEIVVAADLKNGIGKGGKLPWRLPGDMARFKTLTVGNGKNAVIMGRKTWESIPARFRPLPDRLNIVVTRNPEYKANGARVAWSFPDAIETARDAERVFIIGGAKIYEEAMVSSACQTIHLTRVFTEADCDVRLPHMPQAFRETESSERFLENGLEYAFVTLRAT